MPPKAKGAGKKNGGYQLPEKFDEGFVLKDVFKTCWTLGKPIGQGGFGLIYLAQKRESRIKNSDDAPYVVKIEPKGNGPLFCETHFYGNCAKEEDIKSFMRSKGLSHLALPKYITSGVCMYNEKEFRFLVMDRYARDLQSFLNESGCNHQLGEVGVMCLMRQMLYTLEYIHTKGYSHGDIKGANLMLKSDAESYLVDYGLAVRFRRDNSHLKYEIKPERKHNGTIEYTSRDAHCGAQISRRSDMEILGYCVVHWLSGTLPWIDLIHNNEQVHQSKIKNMNNVKEFITNTFKSVANVSNTVKTFLEFYLSEVNKLEYDSEPAYGKIHTKLNEALKSLGHSGNADNFGLFSKPKAAPKKKQAMASAVVISDTDKDELEESKTAKDTSVAARRKRVNKKTVDEDVGKVVDSDEEEKKKPAPRGRKPQTPASKKVTKKEISESSDEDKFDEDELSDLEDQAIYSKKISTKKPRTVESKLIDEHTNGIITPKKQASTPGSLLKIGSENKRTPRSTARAKSPIEPVVEVVKDSPMRPVANGHRETPIRQKIYNKNFDVHNHSQTENDEDDDDDDFEMNGHAVARVPIANGKKDSPAMNKAQLEVINRIKLNQERAKSPLALVNTVEAQSEAAILVRKRKNVPKSTVATQTDKSYLQSLKLKNLL